MIEIKIKSDDAGLKYIIPAQRSEEFDKDYNTGCDSDDWNWFDDKWGKYIGDPDELRLYTLDSTYKSTTTDDESKKIISGCDPYKEDTEAITLHIDNNGSFLNRIPNKFDFYKEQEKLLKYYDKNSLVKSNNPYEG